MRRKVVGLWLAAAPDQPGLLLGLVHVMRNRSHVVEELAEDVPAPLALHDGRAEQQIAGRFDGLPQLEAIAVRPDVAEALIGWRAWSIVGVGRGRKPPLVDAAPVATERIEIVRDAASTGAPEP